MQYQYMANGRQRQQTNNLLITQGVILEDELHPTVLVE